MTSDNTDSTLKSVPTSVTQYGFAMHIIVTATPRELRLSPLIENSPADSITTSIIPALVTEPEKPAKPIYKMTDAIHTRLEILWLIFSFLKMNRSAPIMTLKCKPETAIICDVPEYIKAVFTSLSRYDLSPVISATDNPPSLPAIRYESLSLMF